jgi:electron transfer flavoprotein alpha subunit
MHLVIAEQRSGRLNRASWEAVAAAQQLGASTGEPVAILVAGSNVAAAANELAAAQVNEVLSVEHPALDPYTPDGLTAALEQIVPQLSPSHLLFPHTYQTRDFAPTLAARLDRPLVTDCVVIKSGDAGVVFGRPMFKAS